RDRNVTGVQTCALPIFPRLLLGSADSLHGPDARLGKGKAPRAIALALAINRHGVNRGPPPLLRSRPRVRTRCVERGAPRSRQTVGGGRSPRCKLRRKPCSHGVSQYRPLPSCVDLTSASDAMPTR